MVWRVPGLISLALTMGHASSLAQIPAGHEASGPPLVPGWVAEGVPVRVVLVQSSRLIEGRAPSDKGWRGRFLNATADSLWTWGPKTEVAIGFDRAELRRVDLALKRHSAAARGALIGLVAGGLGGLLGTAVIGEAETDGVLPAWGLLVGPFIGAAIGSCFSVDDWQTVWEAEVNR
jgi:hypothetical protein